jgi:hypothetical protein
MSLQRSVGTEPEGVCCIPSGNRIVIGEGRPILFLLICGCCLRCGDGRGAGLCLWRGAGVDRCEPLREDRSEGPAVTPRDSSSTIRATRNSIANQLELIGRQRSRVSLPLMGRLLPRALAPSHSLSRSHGKRTATGTRTRTLSLSLLLTTGHRQPRGDRGVERQGEVKRGPPGPSGTVLVS